jgi:hypothetical protein
MSENAPSAAPTPPVDLAAPAADGRPALTAEERAAARRAFEDELRADHERRQAKVASAEERRSAHRQARDVAARTVALNELKEQVRTEFYKTHDYRRYLDSTGREVWLSPKEYELRTRRRGKRRGLSFDGERSPRWKAALLYGGLFVIALVMGLLLSR